MTDKVIVFMDRFHIEQDADGNDIEVFGSVRPDAKPRLRFIRLGQYQLKMFSAEVWAKRDVPAGIKFKIMDWDEMPAKDEFRNAWEIADELLTDGVGNTSGLFESLPGQTEVMEG